jgi:LysM repeat protein
MLARSRARYLAPIALVATIAGTYATVHAGLKPKPAVALSQRPAPVSPAHRHLVRARFYVVSPGDNLTAIAVKTGVSVGTIEAINPNLDPNALQPGQRLRLRR